MGGVVNDTFKKVSPMFNINNNFKSTGDIDTNTEIQKYHQKRYQYY